MDTSEQQNPGDAQPVVLVIDDETQMVSIITFALETSGFRCLSANTAEEGWRILRSHSVDLAVIDVMLPGASGVDLTAEIRKHSNLPIILLTALGEEEDRISGLEAGADDYVTKPFSPRELVLWAHTIMRRTRPQAENNRVQVGELMIDRVTLESSWRGKPLGISRGEVKLLLALAENPHAFLTPRELLRQVWDAHDSVSGRDTLKTAVYRLRCHLRECGFPDNAIESRRGTGYALKLS